MIDLPMMGATGIPSRASYFPPAPSTSVGGLGGLGGKVVNFVNSGNGSDMVRALGFSLMSSPGNHWLRDMPQHYAALGDERRTKNAEQRALLQSQQERDALVAFGVHLGIPENEMRSLAPNEVAAKARIQQAVQERDTARTQAANKEALGILSGGKSSPSPADAVSAQHDSWGSLREQYGWNVPRTEATGDYTPRASSPVVSSSATVTDAIRAKPNPAVREDARRVGFNQTQAHLLAVLANPSVSQEVRDVAKMKYEELSKASEPTTEMKNFEHYLGLNEQQRDDYEDFRRSGSSQVNIAGPEKGYDKTIGEGYGRRFLDMQTEAQSAQRALNALSVMEQSIQQPGFYSGAAVERVQQLKRVGTALGMNPEGIDSMETFNAMSKAAALDAMGGSLGSGFSNADRDFVIDQVPNLGNTPEGNRKLVEIQKLLNQRKLQIAQLARDYASQNQDRIDPGFDDFLSRWAESNPLFAGGNSAPAGAVDLLLSDPSLAPQFDQKYGAGAAERILRGQ